MSDKLKKHTKERTSLSSAKSLGSKYKFHLLFIIGIILIPTGVILGTETKFYSNDEIVNNEFSKILISIKTSEVEKFEQKLEKMKEDPLDGLYDDKMPTAEEIFYSEWANDNFPEINIPIIGQYIKEVGREKIGDIDLDGKSPQADLNITSVKNPSNLNYFQCSELWNPKNKYSFTYDQFIWFKAAENDTESENSLLFSFNLTYSQLDLICAWLETGKDTWIRFLSRREIIVINLFPFLGFIIPGVLLSGYSMFKRRNEIKNVFSKKNDKKVPSKSKDLKSK